MRILFTFISLITVIMTYAQTTQTGIVQEYNERSKKTPLAGVELNVRSAGNTVSNNKGEFSLQFLTLKPGEKVNVRRIEKLGYEIFNKEAVEQWNINPKTPFIIIMCKSDRFKRIRDNYEKVSSESYARQLKKEEAALAKLKEEGKIKEREYEQQLAELRENYDRQLDNLENYVDRFSRIDLSEISGVEQDIIELVQHGKIDEAITRYEEQNLIEKYLKENEDVKEISSAIYRLSDVKTAKEQSKDSLLVSVERYISTLQLAGGRDNNEKILKVIRTIADADTTNIDWLLKTGLFIADYFADYDLALSYYQTALASALAQYGEHHPDVASSYNNIGGVYSSLGDYPKALENYNRALKIFVETYGENNPEVSLTYNNIGYVYSSLGDYSKALENYNKALKIRLETYGENHPYIAAIYDNIGSLCAQQGDYSKALENYNKALKIWVETYGENHPEVSLTYNNIGYVYYSLGDYSEALENYNKALKIRLDNYDANHPDIAVSYDNIGSVCAQQGDYSKALENYNKALKIRLEIFGENHPDVAISYNNIGVAYDNLGDYSGALENHNKALKIKLRTYGENHPGVATSYNSIGSVYSSLGDYSKALENYNKALKIRLETYGESHPYVATNYNNIGSVYSKLGDYSKAMENYSKVLKIWMETYGESHPYVATSYNNIGYVYSSLGDYSKALENYNKALKIRLETYGESHPDVALNYNIIGSVYSSLGDYSKALESYNKALKIRLETYGENHPYIISCYAELYSSYLKELQRNDSVKEEFIRFMADKALTGTVAGKDSPAARQGLDGEYLFLKFGDWEHGSMSKDFFEVNTNLMGKPKDIVIYRDGKVLEFHFDNRIGMELKLKKISAEDNKSLEKAYQQWKTMQAAAE